MTIADVVSLLGGIALFLFGMSLMGEGLKKVAEDFGVETKYVECTDSSKYNDYLEGLVAGGYNVICCDSFNMEEALRASRPSIPMSTS